MTPQTNQAWMRLTAAARQARDDRGTEVPYGFATRVSALAFAQERRSVSLVERLALRALAVASLLAVCSVALNYSEFGSSPTALSGLGEVTESAVPADDAVALVLGVAD